MLLEKGACAVEKHTPLPDFASLVEISKQRGVDRDQGEFFTKPSHRKCESVITQAIAAIHPRGPRCDIGNFHG